MKNLILGCFCLIFIGTTSAALKVTLINNNSQAVRFHAYPSADFKFNDVLYSTRLFTGNFTVEETVKPGEEKTFLYAIRGEEKMKKLPAYFIHINIITAYKSVISKELSWLESGHVTFTLNKNCVLTHDHYADNESKPMITLIQNHQKIASNNGHTNIRYGQIF